MTNKGFMKSLAERMELDKDTCSQLVSAFIGTFAASLNEDKSITVQGFGSFEQKRKAKRKMYNPITKTYKVIPSKTVLNYKMSPVLKDKVNS